ncbi:TspO/MBR-related protein [Rhodotorula diobovata]|uniref:TspO/MBR-related protein n=1 Tax=Rhodotorula diobovata TaxID=5288 RepID=A0A5C5FQ55_9BASI|nr:TspO/MBR-related protein [Rhodotorula diobovata]
MPFTLPPILLQLPRNPAIAVGLPLVLGMADGQVTKSSLQSWYPSLTQPAGEPPRWAFPVVWTTLYVGMGFASHVLVKALDTAIIGSPTSRLAMSALKLYWAQLALNLAWTPLFFGLRNPLLGLADILPLTATTYALAGKAYKVDPRTAFVFVPYCAWLSYATYLNAGIWWLNGGEAKIKKAKQDAKKDL